MHTDGFEESPGADAAAGGRCGGHHEAKRGAHRGA